MTKTVAVAVQQLLMDAGIVEIYMMGNIAVGSAILLASLFALGFAIGLVSWGE